LKIETKPLQMEPWLLLTTCDLHIKNSKNYKRWYYSAARWHTVNV